MYGQPGDKYFGLCLRPLARLIYICAYLRPLLRGEFPSPQKDRFGAIFGRPAWGTSMGMREVGPPTRSMMVRLFGGPNS